MTMQALADSLGISRTTVSLVLQGKGSRYRISRKTQEKILEQAASLNYRPNYFASALNKGKTGVIGVVFPDVFESFMGRIARGIESVLYEKEYTMMLSTSLFDNKREKQIVEQFMYRGVDGFLIIFAAPFSGCTFDYSHLAAVKARGIPMVCIDRYLDDVDVPRITANDFESARKGVAELINRGADRVVCVSFDLDVSTLRERMRGYEAAIDEANRAAAEKAAQETASAERAASNKAAVERAAQASVSEALHPMGSGDSEKAKYTGAVFSERQFKKFKKEYILLSRCDPESQDLFQAVSECMPNSSGLKNGSGDSDPNNDSLRQARSDLNKMKDGNAKMETSGLIPDFFVTTSGLADKTAWILNQLGYELVKYEANRYDHKAAHDKRAQTKKTVRVLRFGETPQWQDSGIIDIPQPHESMGREAASKLLQMIKEKN